MTDIVDKLRKQAEEFAEGRRIAEFGPAGGNPDAKAEQHLEWKAADRIEHLESAIRDAIEVEEFGYAGQSTQQILNRALYEEEPDGHD